MNIFQSNGGKKLEELKASNAEIQKAFDETNTINKDLQEQIKNLEKSKKNIIREKDEEISTLTTVISELEDNLEQLEEQLSTNSKAQVRVEG